MKELRIVGKECKEAWINKPFAQNYEVKDLEKDNSNILRVYCSQSPDIYTFQIRTFKPITDNYGKGKNRNMIAHCTLSIAEVKALLAFMEHDH